MSIKCEKYVALSTYIMCLFSLPCSWNDWNRRP